MEKNSSFSLAGIFIVVVAKNPFDVVNTVLQELVF
jgi:hypothetical protein